MLPKKNRINKNTFKTIWDKGNVVFGSFFIFHFLYDKKPKFSFVVSKKICETAVKRNFLRRKGYNILKSLKIECGNGIFIYKKEALNVIKTDKIKEDIKYLLKKANFIS